MCTDYERPDMYCQTMRKAKKRHECRECGREVAPGEKYQHVAGIWEGDFDTYKTCGHCVAGQNLLLRECHGFIHTQIQEELDKHLAEVLPWRYKAARIIVGMRRRWQRFDGKGLMKLEEI